jgi:hypothetical protein
MPIRNAVVLVIALTIGCSEGPRLYTVSGTVTVNKMPLAKGVIYFNPDPRTGNDGPQGHAIIDGGQYTTTGPMGKGIVGGGYVIRIECFDGIPGAELPMGKKICADFETTRDLPKADSQQDFDVPMIAQ